MQELPEQSIATWTSGPGNRSYAGVIDWECPRCSRAVSFAMNGWNPISNEDYWSMARCPRCRSNVTFFALNLGTGQVSLAGGALFMFPGGRTRAPAKEVLDSSQLGDPVKSAYRSAVSIVNGGEWNGGAVLCRRLLEGITKTILPKELHAAPLAKQLELLPSHRDLTQPLLELAHAVRKGGNLGAHFDLEREPDQQVTTLMLELCEDLLQYLFVLPERIAELHTKIENLGSAADGDQ